VAHTVLQLREFLEGLPDRAHVWVEGPHGLLVTDADNRTYYELGGVPAHKDVSFPHNHFCTCAACGEDLL
jgi:hypothetical protein